MMNFTNNSIIVNEIFLSLINLLSQKEFSEISITEITKTANVSRNSFYRNFSSKEDIIEKYIHESLTTWQKQYEEIARDSNLELFTSLFTHLKNNGDFYLLLKRKDIFYLFNNVYLKLYGPLESDSNVEAYAKKFIAGGVLGWIEEWINRGMTESAESMSTLLSSTGMK